MQCMVSCKGMTQFRFRGFYTRNILFACLLPFHYLGSLSLRAYSCNRQSKLLHKTQICLSALRKNQKYFEDLLNVSLLIALHSISAQSPMFVGVLHYKKLICFDQGFMRQVHRTINLILGLIEWHVLDKYKFFYETQLLPMRKFTRCHESLQVLLMPDKLKTKTTIGVIMG